MNTRFKIEQLEALGLWDEADEERTEHERREADISRLERELQAEREAEERKKKRK